MIENEVLARLPEHLRQYIKPQSYEHYTAIDQSVWNYTMRKSIAFLTNHAHESYQEGLKATGITPQQIPSLYGMNRILKKIGWAAVAVNGFIPPRAFMEFQAYNVLVIASEIRQLKNIEYTPAPDIIHESAGHAPMLVNPEYAAFLKRFGEIGAKAISSPFNTKLFDAIRKLSILKESKNTLKEAIHKAEQEVATLQKSPARSSEMDQLRNLHWWSVEYGLIGSTEDFKLYGAGLLSSIGESQWCLSDKVKKQPFTIDVVHQKFDITQPQPQLFVTPDFAHLSKVLEEVANTMGLRKGGKESVEKLIQSEEIGTVELSTGLQISGQFQKIIPHPNNPRLAAYVQTKGATALAFRNQEIVSHGCAYHSEGFGSPIGKLKGCNLAIEDMTPNDLEAFGIIEGNTIRLDFDSGVIVKGKVITGIRNLFGKIMLISLDECTVSFQDQILYQPDWGLYDMAIGKKNTSAYAGPADTQHFPFKKHKMQSTPSMTPVSKINDLYQAMEQINKGAVSFKSKIDWIGPEIITAKPKDWLLVLNFHTLCLKEKNKHWGERALQALNAMKQKEPAIAHLIDEGLQLFSNKQ
jgi:phenylalanine-4-hydroxylase